MRKLLLILSIVLFANVLLTACAVNTNAPVNAVENYLNSLVEKDTDRLSTLVCGAWEAEALTALDGLQGVSAQLENVSCNQIGTDGNTALVNCSGKMVLTYDAEDQELDLSAVTYEVIEEGGDWLICGTR